MDTVATLLELVEKENHDGFRLAVGHFAELDHSLMGNFPAIESKSKEMVMTTDLDLLKKVCETLPPRRFKFGTQLIYVNPETGIAYSILGTNKSSLERAEAFQILTQERFQELTKNEKPFKWAPGLVSNNMSLEEFKETLQVASSKLE